MAISTYPAASGGGIKSVQRGSAGGAGNITITAVDISKSFVTVFGTVSSGTVAASFSLSPGSTGALAWRGPTSGVTNANIGVSQGYYPPNGTGQNNVATLIDQNLTPKWWTESMTVNFPNYSVGAGSNNLVSAQITGFLANSTTLTVSGACRYEVVEFN